MESTETTCLFCNLKAANAANFVCRKMQSLKQSLCQQVRQSCKSSSLSMQHNC